jgi:hypothetical protein
MCTDDNFAPRTTQNGTYLPKRALGSNRLRPARSSAQEPNHYSRAYYFDGISVRDVTRGDLNARIPLLELFRTVSMYFDHSTSRFWLINFDATLRAVGEQTNDDQNQSDSDSDDDDDDDDDDDNEFLVDWRVLEFDWAKVNRSNAFTGLSSAVVVGSQNQLNITRFDQAWPERLLPRNYQPRDPLSRHVPNTQPPQGVLNGNLAILIALVAFTARRWSDVRNVLMHCIRGTAWLDPPQHSGAGCMLTPTVVHRIRLIYILGRDERGLVVHVWINPGWKGNAIAYEGQYLFN